MYYPDYKPTPEEIAIEETRQMLAKDSQDKAMRVFSVLQSISLLQEILVEAQADSEQAMKRYANYLNDNGLSGSALESAVSA